MQIINAVVNYVKVGAIILCDLINKCYDPFEYNLDLPEKDSLAELDRKFAAEIDEEFMMPHGEFLYEHPRPNDSGDTALWQGILTGMKILRRDDPEAAVRFLKTLFVNGTLIRGYYYYGTNLPNDTTSNDSATGPLFAFYTALRFGDPYTREVCGELLVNWASNLKAHNWALVDLNGNPTKFGKLEDGIKTDPLRITLLLAIIALAAVFAPEFHDDYVRLYTKYRPILAYPKVKLLWLDTSYDTHRAAISLHILWWLMKDEVYRDGLRRIWRITKKTNNAWVYVLCWEALEEKDPQFVAGVLGTFSYEQRQVGNVATLVPYWPTVRWGKKIRAKKPLPIFLRGSQDFFWQRYMNSYNEWEGVSIPYVFHSGLDFLVCYHLAKRTIGG